MFSWGQIPHRARTLSVSLTLSTCMLESQALARDGRGGPSLKTSDLPSRAMWYELFSLVASAYEIQQADRYPLGSSCGGGMEP